MVSALDSGSSGPGWSPSLAVVTVLCWARHSTRIVPLHSGVY